jgi:hypothetical protein
MLGPVSLWASWAMGSYFLVDGLMVDNWPGSATFSPKKY